MLRFYLSFACVTISLVGLPLKAQSTEAETATAGYANGVASLGQSSFKANEPEAFVWLSRSAQAGLTSAMVKTAENLVDERGTQKDVSKALERFKKAADAGEIDGMLGAAAIFDGSSGLPANDLQAAEYYRRAATAGSARGMGMLAWILMRTGLTAYKGNLHAFDQTEAYMWARKAGDAGDPIGVAVLARTTQDLSSTPKDETDLYKWFSWSAEAGLPFAKVKQGVMLVEGRGHERDYSAAVKLFDQAARAGDAEGMWRLAVMAEMGWGMPRNQYAADRLANQAWALGDKRGVPAVNAARERFADPKAVLLGFVLGIVMLSATHPDNGPSPDEQPNWAAEAQKREGQHQADCAYKAMGGPGYVPGC